MRRPAIFGSRVAGGEIAAPKVVLAAGLGNAALAPLFGLNAPVQPQKGQILVTERARHVLPMPIDDDPPDDRGRHHAGRQPGRCRFRHQPEARRDADDRPTSRAVIPVAARSADRARLGGAQGDAARWPADLRPVGALSRGVHRQLPQRRHPRRRRTPTCSPRWSRRARSTPQLDLFRPNGSMFRPRREGDPATDRGHSSRAVASWCRGRVGGRGRAAAGFDSIRETPVEGSERAPYCMMGVCFDCLAEIDGVPNRQSCMVEVHPGMQISRQMRARNDRSDAAMTIELAIIGAGPAGMAAAVLAAELGRRDRADRRATRRRAARSIEAIERAEPDTPLGADYLAGRPLAAALQREPRRLPAGHDIVASRSRRHAIPRKRRPHRDLDRAPHPARDRRARTAGADPRLDLARRHDGGRGADPPEVRGSRPGGPRRAWPDRDRFSTWSRRSSLRAGAPPIAHSRDDTARRTISKQRAARRLWAGRRHAVKGLGLISAVKRAGIPIRRGVRGLRAVGQRSLDRVAWEGGELAADHLFLHEGVIPNVQVSLALQLRHEWDEAQLCWRPALDPWGQTSLPNIAVAGDGGRHRRRRGGGAVRAARRARCGRCGSGISTSAERDRRAAPIRAALDRERALRPFLDRLYRPAPSVLAPGRGRRHRLPLRGSLGRPDPPGGAARSAGARTSSRPSRAAGWGPARAGSADPLSPALIADVLGKHIAEIGTYRPRAPFKPITVGALADLRS